MGWVLVVPILQKSSDVITAKESKDTVLEKRH